MKSGERKKYFVGIVVSNFIGDEYCYAQILSTTDKERGRNTILDIMHTKDILPENATILEKMCFQEYKEGLENFIGWHNIISDNNGKNQWIRKSQEEIDEMFDYNTFVPSDSIDEWDEEDYENDYYQVDDDDGWEETLRINQILINQGDY
ncbi:MAG: hypothetical protein E6176_06665 [Clostridium celatum]|nr:hypothetical protein [Clostridium celatum]